MSYAPTVAHTHGQAEELGIKVHVLNIWGGSSIDVEFETMVDACTFAVHVRDTHGWKLDLRADPPTHSSVYSLWSHVVLTIQPGE